MKRNRASYSILSVGLLSVAALACAPLVFGMKRVGEANGSAHAEAGKVDSAVTKDPFIKGSNSVTATTSASDVDNPFGPVAKRTAEEARLREQKIAELEEEAGVSEAVALLEYIQTDLVTANKLLSEFGANEDAKPLRKRLEGMIDEGTAQLIETCFMRTNNGLRMNIQSIREHIYPSEFDPPEIPQEMDRVSVSPPVTSANPTAFDYRDVGSSTEIDAQIGQIIPEFPELRSISLQIAPELVRYLGESVIVPNGQPEQRVITQPDFEVLRLQLGADITCGATSLLGMLNPKSAEGQRIFVLVSADNLGGRAKKVEEPPIKQVKRHKIVTHLEYISIGHREANKLLRAHWANRDAGELRAIMEDKIEKGEAELIESIYVKGLNGVRVKAASVQEHIYPTEWDPAEIPQKLRGYEVEIKATGANPTAFDVRNVGTTVEIEAQIGAEGQEISLNIAPEIVRFLGNRRMGDPENWESLPPEIRGMVMPDFSVMRLATSITAFNGQRNLIGLFNPPTTDNTDTGERVMLFVKVDVVR